MQGDEGMEDVQETAERRLETDLPSAEVEAAAPAAAQTAPPATAGPDGQPQAARIGRGQGTWLAGRILDPERRLPVVAVTLPPRRDDSWMDMPRLAKLLVGKAELFLVETGAATWELAAALPSRLDVYGGAARIWWPGVTSGSDPYAHPL